MKYKILIIEDEYKYAYILERYFTNDGFSVELAFDGQMGYKKFLEFDPDIICLDIMLPAMDGYEVAKRVRAKSNVPIIMMSALAGEQDVLKGYTLHIDEYVTKPFKNSVLVAKVKNLLQRRKELSEEKIKTNEVIIKDVKIFRDTYQCYLRGGLIKLSKTEFLLLEYLMLNAGKTCTREALLALLWSEKDIEERIIDTYIKKIRKLLSPDNYITTVFGIGYRFALDSDDISQED